MKSPCNRLNRAKNFRFLAAGLVLTMVVVFVFAGFDDEDGNAAIDIAVIQSGAEDDYTPVSVNAINTAEYPAAGVYWFKIGGADSSFKVDIVNEPRRTPNSGHSPVLPGDFRAYSVRETQEIPGSNGK